MNDKKHGAPGANGNPQQHDQATATAAKRGGSRAEERIAALDTSGASLREQVEQLSAQLDAAEQRAAEAEAGWQRARADFANLKRRTEEERCRLGQRGRRSAARPCTGPRG